MTIPELAGRSIEFQEDVTTCPGTSVKAVTSQDDLRSFLLAVYNPVGVANPDQFTSIWLGVVSVKLGSSAAASASLIRACR